MYAASGVVDTQSKPRLARRASIWLIRLLAAGAFATAGFLAWRAAPAIPTQTSLTAGSKITTRALIARALADELSHRGITAELIVSPNTFDELDAVQARRVDFAMVSGLVARRDYPELREVTPLFVEALRQGRSAEAVWEEAIEGSDSNPGEA